MAKTVLIFGAGASVDAGVPIMKNFLDRAEKLHKKSKSSIQPEKFERVFKTLSNMQQIQSKARFDLVNIESVFAGIEFGGLLGVNFSQDSDIGIVRDSFVYLIFRTIELTTKYVRHKDHLEIAGPYTKFMKFLQEYAETERNDSIAIVTFNYDIVLDLLIYNTGLFADYGLPSYRANPSIPLYKLHGSISWGKCSECGQIIPWPIDEYIKHKRLNTEYHGRPQHISLTPGNEISLIECRACKTRVGSTPFIVPPTWNKTQYHSEIEKVWQSAAKHLREAENIFIIGYSLPDTDYFFHYLYAIGTMGASRLKNFWVCNPDPQVDERFKKILGEQAAQRYRFLPEEFDISMSYIIGELSK